MKVMTDRQIKLLEKIHYQLTALSGFTHPHIESPYLNELRELIEECRLTQNKEGIK